MFTPHLYDHKFDIDDLIHALCNNPQQGLWELNTRTGQIVPVTPSAAKPDGSDSNHIHHLCPLPLSFLHELGSHPKRRNLSAADITALDSFLNSCTQLHQCAPFFNTGQAGGWLRERIKEEALEWLDHRSLIPPSMRHAWKTETQAQAPTSALNTPLNAVKIVIE